MTCGGRFHKWITVLALVALPSCDDEGPYQITETRVVKAKTVDLQATTAERFGYRAREADNATNRRRMMFLYDAPEAWEELPAAQFRDVNFRVPGGVVAYVTLLFGGGVEANLNRWRGQMSQEPYTAEELAALPKLPMLGDSALLAEIDGTFKDRDGTQQPDYRLLGLYSEFPSLSVSLKMIGPRQAVAAAREDFEQFAAALRFDMAAIEAAVGESESPETGQVDPSSLVWNIPAGWQTGTGSSMRLVTLTVDNRPGAECWVVALPGDAGGVARNLNRWRSEMGLGPLSPSELDGLPLLRVLGDDSIFIDIEGTYMGMSGGKPGESVMFGVITKLPGYRVFIKMVGRKVDMLEERSNFIAFCESLRVQSGG